MDALAVNKANERRVVQLKGLKGKGETKKNERESEGVCV